MNEIANLAVWYLVFVFSTTCHEAAHAWVAYRGGDLTAYSLGHVTLDPTPHIRRSPFGMVVIPILSFLLPLLMGEGEHGWMIGWASVPVNREWASRHPGRSSVMSLAGPLANLLLAALALGAMRLLVANDVLLASPLEPGFRYDSMVTAPEGHAVNSLVGALARGLSVMLVLNVLLGLFNLFPIPPLDGASVLEGAAPRLTSGFYDRLREVPTFELLGLLVAWRFFPYIAGPALGYVIVLLHL